MRYLIIMKRRESPNFEIQNFMVNFILLRFVQKIKIVIFQNCFNYPSNISLKVGMNQKKCFISDFRFSIIIMKCLTIIKRKRLST